MFWRELKNKGKPIKAIWILFLKYTLRAEPTFRNQRLQYYAQANKYISKA